MRQPPATSIGVLRRANAKGEVGYAHGGNEEDYPAVWECLDRGWIEYNRDYSLIGGPKCTIYRLTSVGRKIAGRT